MDKAFGQGRAQAAVMEVGMPEAAEVQAARVEVAGTDVVAQAEVEVVPLVITSVMMEKAIMYQIFVLMRVKVVVLV